MSSFCSPYSEAPVGPLHPPWIYCMCVLSDCSRLLFVSPFSCFKVLSTEWPSVWFLSGTRNWSGILQDVQNRNQKKMVLWSPESREGSARQPENFAARDQPDLLVSSLSEPLSGWSSPETGVCRTFLQSKAESSKTRVTGPPGYMCQEKPDVNGASSCRTAWWVVAYQVLIWRSKLCSVVPLSPWDWWSLQMSHHLFHHVGVMQHSFHSKIHIYEVCQLYFSFPREFVCVALELKLTWHTSYLLWNNNFILGISQPRSV